MVFLHCRLGEHILPEGWSNWNKTENYKTTWYAEYESEGAGANDKARVAWAQHMTAGEAREFERDVFLRGSDGWKPTSVKLVGPAAVTASH